MAFFRVRLECNTASCVDNKIQIREPTTRRRQSFSRALPFGSLSAVLSPNIYVTGSAVATKAAFQGRLPPVVTIVSAVIDM
jgi:hypothetical protein